MAKINKRKKAQQKARQEEVAQPDRRKLLSFARTGALSLGAVGIFGYFGTRAVQGGLYERDLSRLEAGKPSIVQIHDPSCPTCNALQKEARRALSCFGECELQFLVADIKTDEGAAFAAFHNVPHVTLMLFDASGDLQQVLTGLRTEEELKPIFEAHLAT